tara:strand:+ start:3789 stop:3968 length:180 start_codon:yes stop_codon:yes gene_type:complete
MAKKKKPLPKKYEAPVGSKRYKQLKKASRLYKSGKKQAAYKLRDKMEKKVRDGRKKKKK